MIESAILAAVCTAAVIALLQMRTLSSRLRNRLAQQRFMAADNSWQLINGFPLCAESHAVRAATAEIHRRAQTSLQNTPLALNLPLLRARTDRLNSPALRHAIPISAAEVRKRGVQMQKLFKRARQLGLLNEKLAALACDAAVLAAEKASLQALQQHADQALTQRRPQAAAQLRQQAERATRQLSVVRKA